MGSFNRLKPRINMRLLLWLIPFVVLSLLISQMSDNTQSLMWMIAFIASMLILYAVDKSGLTK